VERPGSAPCPAMDPAVQAETARAVSTTSSRGGGRRAERLIDDHRAEAGMDQRCHDESDIASVLSAPIAAAEEQGHLRPHTRCRMDVKLCAAYRGPRPDRGCVGVAHVRRLWAPRLPPKGSEKPALRFAQSNARVRRRPGPVPDAPVDRHMPRWPSPPTPGFEAWSVRMRAGDRSQQSD
jgi:hypothetical protein